MASPLPLRCLSYYFAIIFAVIALVSADQFCGTISNVTIADPASLGPQTADMNALKFALRYPWPSFETRSGHIRLVRYCFANEKAKEELDCALQAGFKIWSDAIGSPASPENGHSLGLMEVNDRNSDKTKRKHHFCYSDEYKNRQEPGTWNPEVKADVLAFHLGAEGEVPHASVCWEKDKKRREGRHYMVLLHKDIERHKVAHEVGNQRRVLRYPLPLTSNTDWPRSWDASRALSLDRDSYVTFRCDQLVGYQDAYNAALIAARPDIAYSLCNNQDFANKYGFSAGAQYFINDAWSYFNEPLFDSGTFDYGSIMIYPSTANALHPDCFQIGRPDLCPLVAHWNNGPPWEIRASVAPSNADVAFVKKWYAWIGGPAPAPVQSSSASAGPWTPRATQRGEQAAEREKKEEPHSMIRYHRIVATDSGYSDRDL